MPDKIRHQATPGRRSWLGYARILRSVYDRLGTTDTIAHANAMRAETMREVLRRMSSLGLVHINGSEHLGNHIVPRWGIGDDSEAAVPFPTNGPLQPAIELIAFACMWRALGSRPHTAKMLADVCGLTRQRVCEFLKACDEELRVTHVVGYMRCRAERGGTLAAVYAVGFDQPNAVRPAPLPLKELNRRDYQRKVNKKRRYAHLVALAANSNPFSQAA